MYGNKVGDMAWMDLSVPNAVEVKNFYQGLLGWESQGIAMTTGEESYEDFQVGPTSSIKKDSSASDFVTGVCHAKGANADMPAAWLPYFLVSDIDLAVKFVTDNAGALVTPIKSMGDDQFVVIKDPAGAMSALYQKG